MTTLEALRAEARDKPIDYTIWLILMDALEEDGSPAALAEMEEIRAQRRWVRERIPELHLPER